MTTQRYTTSDDAIAQAIIPALGDFAADYDTDAIFMEVFEYKIDKNECGQELLNTAGFEQIVFEDDFWEIVMKHDHSN